MYLLLIPFPVITRPCAQMSEAMLVEKYIKVGAVNKILGM